MGPRDGALLAVLLAAACGEPEDPLEGHQWWYLKPGRYIVDREHMYEAPDAADRGFRTIAWRIGAGDPMRFSIEWSDARSKGVIADITGRIDAGRETQLCVLVEEGPPRKQQIAFSCPHCGQRWREQGGGADSGAQCPKCEKLLEPRSQWHSRPTREVRIRAVPPIAELRAEPGFRRDGDDLVADLDRDLIPVYGGEADIASYLGPRHDGPIAEASPGDIALIFHMPPGEFVKGGGSRVDGRSEYAYERGGIRIEGNERGYEIRRDGEVIPLERFPLPVWRFAFRIEP
jgi:hypothetical protein